MKKSFSLFKGAALNKLGFLPFLMTFLFLTGMQMNSEAQTSSTLPSSSSSHASRTMYDVPSGPFVTSSVAKDRLYDAIKLLKETMAQYAENSGPYQSAFRRYRYYTHIIEHLDAGKTVAEAIAAGLAGINNSLQNGVTPDEAILEKNAAINLLRP